MHTCLGSSAVKVKLYMFYLALLLVFTDGILVSVKYSGVLLFIAIAIVIRRQI